MLIGVALLVIDEKNGDVMGFQDFFDFAGAVLAIAGLIVVLVAVWGIIVGVKVIQEKGWARVAGILTFGVFALLSFGIIATDTSRGENNNNLQTGIANLVACALVVVLLILPAGDRERPA